jgi:hypothetical protein
MVPDAARWWFRFGKAKWRRETAALPVIPRILLAPCPGLPESMER